MNSSAASPAELDAARLLLARMGISPSDLVESASQRTPAPTFAEYVPVVSAGVSEGTCLAYGPYWNRVLDQWGDRRLDEPTPSDIYAVARAYAGHNGSGDAGTSSTYVRADVYEVDNAVATLTGEPHPLVTGPTAVVNGSALSRTPTARASRALDRLTKL